MALDYTTKSGDTWDLIALNVYGSELKADWLMQNNPRYIHIVRFDSGTVLSTPALPAEKRRPSALEGRCMMVLTAARPKGRQAAVLLTYEKTDISEEIAPDLESFKYTDVAESKSDSVSITVNAKAAKWKNDWMPEKGVKLYPAIVVKDWNIGGIESGYRDYSAECGAFVLDDLSFAGAPDSLTMGGVAKPNDTSFSERNRTFTWKNTSVKKIAETIAGRYKLELKFEGDDHGIDAKEQDGTDSAFLQDLCSTYALVIKVYTSKLWVYDREKYKAKDPVWTVYESRPVGNPTALCVEPGSFKWNTKLTGTYTGGLYTYTNKQKKININVKVGTDERQLKLTGKVSSEADAKARLIAAIKNANHGATKISFTMLGYPAGASAQCFNLVGYGKMDGKYFVDQMEHTISPSNGYKTQVKASKVEKEDFA